VWHRLSPDRPFHGGGMGPPVPGNIPWRDLRMWADTHDLTRGQFMMLDICVRKMDEAYRDWVRERQDREQEITKTQQRKAG